MNDNDPLDLIQKTLDFICNEAKNIEKNNYDFLHEGKPISTKRLKSISNKLRDLVNRLEQEKKEIEKILGCKTEELGDLDELRDSLLKIEENIKKFERGEYDSN